MDFLYGAAGGGVVGIIAVVFGLVVFGYFKRVLAERDMLAEKRLSAVENEVREHVQLDRSAVILNELRNISGMQSSQSAMITSLSGEVKQLLISDGKQGEKLDSLNRYIQGVDSSLREHKTNHPGVKK